MTPMERQIKGGEAATVEFLSGPEPFETVARNVGAFLNSGGGTVFIGVGDGGEILGVPDAESVARDLFARLQKAISPKALFSATTEEIRGKRIVVIEMPGGMDRPFVSDGTLFLRKGAQTTKATADDLQNMLQHRVVEVERWERRGAPALSLDDLDTEEIERTVQDALRASRFSFRSGGDREAVLTDFGMLTRGMLTNAADVCFGKRPSIRNPQVRLRAFAFESDKGGNCCNHWRRAVRFLPPTTRRGLPKVSWICRRVEICVTWNPPTCYAAKVRAKPPCICGHKDRGNHESGHNPDIFRSGSKRAVLVCSIENQALAQFGSIIWAGIRTLIRTCSR